VAPGLSLQALVDDYVLEYGFRAFPVVDGESVLGVIGIDALRGMSEAERRASTVKDRLVPLSDALQVSPDCPLSEAWRQLATSGAGRLLVIRDHELAGLLTKEALMRFIEIRTALGGGEGAERA
jgi:CBS domain-containing protein